MGQGDKSPHGEPRTRLGFETLTPHHMRANSGGSVWRYIFFGFCIFKIRVPVLGPETEVEHQPLLPHARTFGEVIVESPHVSLRVQVKMRNLKV